jgi:DNA-binding Xre family transcriptional regulator
MPKIKKNEATIAIDNLIKSEKYKDYRDSMNAVRLLIANMQEVMEKKNITLEELASRMQVSKTYISKILYGEKTNFTIKTLVKFCISTDSKLVFLPLEDKTKPTSLTLG